MNTITAIITTLSEEEKKEFVTDLKRKTRRSDTKNTALFQLIEKGNTMDLDIKLYGKPSKNAYHALCKRLQDSLIEFIAAKSFAGETSEEMDILKQLLASRIFFEHKQYKIAFRTLHKAERTALEHDLYSILNEVYHTKIQYAHVHPLESLEEIITSSNRNLKFYNREIQLNMAYASIKHQISKGEQAISEIIANTFKNFDIDIDTNLTYKSLYQLLNILTTAAQFQSDYFTVLPIVNEIYEAVNEKKTGAGKHLFYHIKILNLMALVSFRNKDFKNSIAFVEKMEIEMLKENGTYFKRFSEELVLLKSLNFNYTGHPETAIALLNTFPKKTPQTELTHAMFLFQQRNFKDAYGIVKMLRHSNTFYEKKSGWIWVLQKNIIELLLLIELDELDLVLSRLQSFKRKFFPKLKKLNEIRVINFIKLVSYYYDKPEEVKSQSFKEMVERSFEWKDVGEEDIFVMSFYAWLKSKMDGTLIYPTTLALINRT